MKKLNGCFALHKYTKQKYKKNEINKNEYKIPKIKEINPTPLVNHDVFAAPISISQFICVAFIVHSTRFIKLLSSCLSSNRFYIRLF